MQLKQQPSRLGTANTAYSWFSVFLQKKVDRKSRAMRLTTITSINQSDKHTNNLTARSVCNELLCYPEAYYKTRTSSSLEISLMTAEKLAKHNTVQV